MKTGAQMTRDCEALQRLEHITAEDWHDMAEADAALLVQLVRTPKLNDEERSELVRAAERLRFYAYWARSYTLALMTISARL
jgi:hypothetical protein